MGEPAFLVTDQIYPKTSRHLEKLKRCVDGSEIVVCCVEGFGAGLPDSAIAEHDVKVWRAPVERLARDIKSAAGEDAAVVALNQSGVLPGEAIRKLLEQDERIGQAIACDKEACRKKLASHDKFAVRFAVAGPDVAPTFFAAPRYVVKPCFGMSSRDVRVFVEWDEAVAYAQSAEIAKAWLPEDIVRVLWPGGKRTDLCLIEEWLEGPEFSIDGWISADGFEAIVQHKLYNVEPGGPAQFIGDGMTVTPPLAQSTARRHARWSSLVNSEDTFTAFGRGVLDAIGFSHGVFHIEARENPAEPNKVSLVEINPRAPGGSLWRSAAYRNGYDLEFVDAWLQIRADAPPADAPSGRHALHYPLYAHRPGRLVSWDGIDDAARANGHSIDFAVELGHRFSEEDMREEPYLAFIVASDDSRNGLLRRAIEIERLAAPRIE